MDKFRVPFPLSDDSERDCSGALLPTMPNSVAATAPIDAEAAISASATASSQRERQAHLGKPAGGRAINGVPLNVLNRSQHSGVLVSSFMLYGDRSHVRIFCRNAVTQNHSTWDWRRYVMVADAPNLQVSACDLPACKIAQRTR